MIQNDYEKPKKKRGAKKISGFEQLKFKRSVTALKEKKVEITASKIEKEANLEARIRTVHRALLENRYPFKNGKKTLLLNKKQKAEGVRLCSNWLISPPDWKKAVFYGLKKFNLDGPDNWKTWIEEMTKFYLNKRQ